MLRDLFSGARFCKKCDRATHPRTRSASCFTRAVLYGFASLLGPCFAVCRRAAPHGRSVGAALRAAFGAGLRGGHWCQKHLFEVSSRLTLSIFAPWCQISPGGTQERYFEYFRAEAAKCLQEGSSRLVLSIFACPRRPDKSSKPRFATPKPNLQSPKPSFQIAKPSHQSPKPNRRLGCHWA